MTKIMICWSSHHLLKGKASDNQLVGYNKNRASILKVNFKSYRFTDFGYSQAWFCRNVCFKNLYLILYGIIIPAAKY